MTREVVDGAGTVVCSPQCIPPGLAELRFVSRGDLRGAGAGILPVDILLCRIMVDFPDTVSEGITSFPDVLGMVTPAVNIVFVRSILGRIVGCLADANLEVLVAFEGD